MLAPVLISLLTFDSEALVGLSGGAVLLIQMRLCLLTQMLITRFRALVDADSDADVLADSEALGNADSEARAC